MLETNLLAGDKLVSAPHSRFGAGGLCTNVDGTHPQLFGGATDVYPISQWDRVAALSTTGH